MNYEAEKKRYLSFCGSYCRTCDWFTGKIRNTFQAALDLVDIYGFHRWLEGTVDPAAFKAALTILATTTLDSGCKAEITPNPADDRCQIRQCCSHKGFDLCNECPEFPCPLLTSNPGVIKFHCIENLRAIQANGLPHWIDQQLAVPS